MAEMDKEEFKFPDEDQGKPLEQIEEEQKLEASGPELEIEIEDDTPLKIVGVSLPPKKLYKSWKYEVNELDQYSEDAKKKMIQMKKIWNDERRAREAAEREQQAALDAAKRLREENERIKTHAQ